MRDSGPFQGLPIDHGDAATLLEVLSNELKAVSLLTTRRIRLDKIIAQLRYIYPSCRPAVRTIEFSALGNPIDHSSPPQNASSRSTNISTATSPRSSSSPSVVPDSQGGGFESMGGVLGTVAAMPALSTSPNDPQPLLQHPNDLPPLMGLEASFSPSCLPEEPWTLVQSLTKSIASIAERLERLEDKNRFAPLPLDEEGPSRPAPSPYAAAVTRPTPPTPAAPAPAAPAPRPAPARTEKPLTEGVTLRTGFLAPDHPLCALEPSRVLHRIRDEVGKQFLPLPPLLLRATRLERGDILLIAKTPTAAALLRRALPLVWPTLETVDQPERLTVFLHKLGVEVEEGEVRVAVEKAIGEEGVVKRWEGLKVREGARWRSAAVELWNAEHVVRLLSQKFLFVRPGVVADVERARSRGEQRAWREERMREMRQRREEKEEEEKKEEEGKEGEEEAAHPNPPPPAGLPTQSTPLRSLPTPLDLPNTPSRLPNPSLLSSPGLSPIVCPSFTNTGADACASRKDASVSVEVTKTVVHEEELEGLTPIAKTPPPPTPFLPADFEGELSWEEEGNDVAARVPHRAYEQGKDYSFEAFLAQSAEERAAEKEGDVFGPKVKKSAPAGTEGPLALMSLTMTSSEAAEGLFQAGEGEGEGVSEVEEEGEEVKPVAKGKSTAGVRAMEEWTVGLLAAREEKKKGQLKETKGKRVKGADRNDSSEDELYMPLQ